MKTSKSNSTLKNQSFAFATCKGGTGKTQLVYQMAGVLSSLGYKVLCIDGDPQHNLSKAFLKTTPEVGLMEVLMQDLEEGLTVKDVIAQPYPNHEKLKNIFILPTNYHLFYFIQDGNMKKVFRLKKVLEELHAMGENYDFIFIDTNPSISLVTSAVLTYTHHVIGVFDGSIDSIEGFQFLEKEIIQSTKEDMNPKLNIFGMMINNIDTRTNFSTVMIETLEGLYQDLVFSEIISPSTVNRESRAARIPLVEYAPSHKSTQQFIDLTNAFLRKVNSVSV